MAALSATNLTLNDWAKRTDPQGDIPVIANLLSQTNEILKDAVFKMGNLPTGHRVVITTGLPTVTWRSLNQGIAPSKATTAQVDEGVGMCGKGGQSVPAGVGQPTLLVDGITVGGTA